MQKKNLSQTIQNKIVLKNLAVDEKSRFIEVFVWLIKEDRKQSLKKDLRKEATND